MNGLSRVVALAVVVVTAFVLAVGAYAVSFTGWAPAQKIDDIAGNSPDLNTASLDGCPIQSPDGRSLYMASNRPGGLGGLDIWVAYRSKDTNRWGAPINLGEPVNSASDDFCPTPVRGGLYFVSREALPGACGQGDIYFASQKDKSWSEPVRLLCSTAGGPNSELDEQGPSYVRSDGREMLFFSRGSGAPFPVVPGEIFVSEKLGDLFGPAVAVSELNDATANDIQPNVRKDGREVVFSSNRAGGAGAQDVWVSTRRSIADPWSAPVNLGSAVNTTASESRPSLSWHAEQLLFGRSPGPEGSNDIYVTTREREK